MQNNLCKSHGSVIAFGSIMTPLSLASGGKQLECVFNSHKYTTTKVVTSILGLNQGSNNTYLLSGYVADTVSVLVEPGIIDGGLQCKL